MHRIGLVVSLLVMSAACKGKEHKPAEPPSGSGSATAGSAGSAVTPAGAGDGGSAAGSAAAAGAGSGTGLLAAGASPALGCFAWNAETKTAACIGGSRSHTGGENELSLDILDGRPSIRLADPLDAESATRNNGELAGFEKIAAAPTPLAAGKPIEVTKGLSLTMTVKQTQAGGENEPPTKSTTIEATCGKAKARVFSLEDEGSEVTATTRVLGDVVIVETLNNVGREGESFETAEAARIEVATCKVNRSGGQ